jgi:hypothetical protein
VPARKVLGEQGFAKARWSKSQNGNGEGRAGVAHEETAFHSNPVIKRLVMLPQKKKLMSSRILEGCRRFPVQAPD